MPSSSTTEAKEAKPPKTYWLPNKANSSTAEVIPFVGQSVILIGGNGSGKSKLGAWIEKMDPNTTHRIAPQRSLILSSNPQLMSYEDAEKFILNGQGDDRNAKWGWGQHYTTSLVSDFNQTVAAIFALEHTELLDYKAKYRDAQSTKTEYPELEKTTVEKLCEIWNLVFPQRRLTEKDSKFFSQLRQPNGKDLEYLAAEMSDGERGALYLTAQILSLKGARIVIVDEPEIHLHGSIMHRLWLAIEQERKDCRFIYITHDTEFASSHPSSERYWIKSFDGKNWDYEKIEDESLPQDLLLEILGSRKDVLFVEGLQNSLDISLYSLLLPDFFIVPCGSCQTVIENTKVFSKSPMLVWCKVRGIVDRDYRSEEEIEKLAKQKVFTCEVAEIENLFLVEPLIRAVAKQLNKSEEETEKALDQIHSFVEDMMIKQRSSQKKAAVESVIKYRLASLDVSDVHDQKELESLIQGKVQFETISNELDNRYPDDISSLSIDGILRVFNDKGLSKTIGRFLGLDPKQYPETVLGMMRGWSEVERRSIFEKYFPFEKLEA